MKRYQYESLNLGSGFSFGTLILVELPILKSVFINLVSTPT